MKISIIRPPKYCIHGATPIPIVPPLGVALLAASLIKEGFEVQAIDAIAEAPNQFQKEEIPIAVKEDLSDFNLITMGLSFEEIAEKIPQDTQLIGFSTMFSINWPLDRELIKQIGKRFPNAIIIAGGESTTGMAEVCLKQVDCLKACVLGEGEEIIVEVAKAIQNNLPFEGISGLMYKNTEGQIIKNANRARIKNVDEVPFPAWELFPIENYQKHRTVPEEEPRITLSIMATRGCPYQCTFCTSPDMWGTRYYMRSPENVVKEIEIAKNKFGATNFEFFDLTAIIKKKWIIDFTNLLIEKELNITWKIPAGTRSEAIDEEVASNLKKSGCYFITYAPESGSPQLLKRIKKKVNLESILNSIKDSKKTGMIVYINMIIGLPDETHLDVWKTLWFLIKCKLAGVDEMPLGVFRPYPGSVLFDRLVEEGKIDLDKDDFYIDSLFIIESLKRHENYNSSVSSFWYKLYLPLTYVIFYGLEYMKKPKKIVQILKNLGDKNYQTELERKLSRNKQELP